MIIEKIIVNLHSNQTTRDKHEKTFCTDNADCGHADSLGTNGPPGNREESLAGRFQLFGLRQAAARLPLHKGAEGLRTVLPHTLRAARLALAYRQGRLPARHPSAAQGPRAGQADARGRGDAQKAGTVQQNDVQTPGRPDNRRRASASRHRQAPGGAFPRDIPRKGRGHRRTLHHRKPLHPLNDCRV